MKTLFSDTGRILVLLVFGTIILVFVLSLRQGFIASPAAGQAQPEGYPGPEEDFAQSVTGLDPFNSYPGPANPVQSQQDDNTSSNADALPAIVEEPGVSEPILTPLPGRGVRVGLPTEVNMSQAALSGTNAAIERLGAIDFDDRLLAAKAIAGDDVFAVVINVESDRIEQSIPIALGSEGPVIADNYLAWAEPLSETGLSSNMRQLQVLNLRTGQNTTVKQGQLRQVDLKDDVLVWQEYHDSMLGIYGYNLRSKEEFMIVRGSKFFAFPRLCSSEWVIYLQFEQLRPDNADLYASNLKTKENILIGQIPFPQIAGAGNHHACDDDYVAWISSEVVAPGHYEQHLYDLRTQTDQTLDLDVVIKGLAFKVKIDGHILLSAAGYDLGRNVPFSLLIEHTFEHGSGSTLHLSGGKLAWVLGAGEASWRLYTADVIQDDN